MNRTKERAPEPRYGTVMRTWRFRHHSSVLETQAKTPEKARCNFRWQLVRECGMARYDAMNVDINPITEVRR